MVQQAVVELAIKELVVAPQVRQDFDEEREKGLALSIREVGILQPLRVRAEDGRPIIVDGERRYRAAKRLGLTTLPVIFEPIELSPADVLQRQLVANCQRDDLRPVEKARAIAHLMKATECSKSDVANKLGMSNAAVTRSLAILVLPSPLKDQVNTGQIPASAAYELARIKDPEQQADFAAKLVAGQMTRDRLTGTIKAQKPTSEATKPSHICRARVQVGPGRSVTVSSDSLSIETFIAVLEDVLMHARKARTKGVTLPGLCRQLRNKADT